MKSLKKVSKEYFNRHDVIFFGQTLSGLLDARNAVQDLCTPYLHDMIAIAVRDWWRGKKRPLKSRDDLIAYAGEIGDFIEYASSCASCDYYRIIYYFDLRYGGKDMVAKTIGGYITVYAEEILESFRKLFC